MFMILHVMFAYLLNLDKVCSLCTKDFFQTKSHHHPNCLPLPVARLLISAVAVCTD